MIWATVSSWSCFCWRYRASPSLAAKNIISLISVLTIRWCPCVESSLVSSGLLNSWLVMEPGEKCTIGYWWSYPSPIKCQFSGYILEMLLLHPPHGLWWCSAASASQADLLLLLASLTPLLGQPDCLVPFSAESGPGRSLELQLDTLSLSLWHVADDPHIYDLCPWAYAPLCSSPPISHRLLYLKVMYSFGVCFRCIIL